MNFPTVKAPDKLLFGTAGIPLSTEKPNTLSGIHQVKKLGLDAMELEFVQSVHLNEESAKKVYDANKDIMLTCHGQYFINLNAKEPQKIGASRSRILKAANISRLAGAWSMTFHAAYYLGMEHEPVYKNVKDQMKKIVDELKANGNEIWVRPETTGKPTQFGSLKEILRLSQELDQVMPCVDFAHLHARTGGKENSTAEFRATLELIEKGLGRKGLENMHIHMSGIAYSEKGERNHLTLKESDFKYEELIKVWKEFKIKGVVISESPNIEEDAKMMQRLYS